MVQPQHRRPADLRGSGSAVHGADRGATVNLLDDAVAVEDLLHQLLHVGFGLGARLGQDRLDVVLTDDLAHRTIYVTRPDLENTFTPDVLISNGLIAEIEAGFVTHFFYLTFLK